MQVDEKQTYTCMYTLFVRSVRRAIKTIFKHKQAKNKPTRACIPRSKRQTSSQTSHVDACKLKQTKKQSDTCKYTSF